MLHQRYVSPQALRRWLRLLDEGAPVTGADLKKVRLERGIGLREQARLAGVSHRAVTYWEAKTDLDPRAYAVRAICAVFGWDSATFVRGKTRAGYRLFTREETEQLLAEHARIEAERALVAEGLATHKGGALKLKRVICGAKTRKGLPCRAKSEPGKRRCRFHGGMSTGAKTPEGRARQVEGIRRYWAKVRAERAAASSP